MLSKNQQAALDEVKVNVNRVFSYNRSNDGIVEADLVLEIESNVPAIHGFTQTIDELEYAVARLIATARKEVSHGKAQPTKELAWNAK